MKQFFTRSRLFLFTLLFSLVPYSLTAQSRRGNKGLQEAAQEIRGYFDDATLLVYVISAVIGLIGAIKVYHKFSNGDPDTGKTAASWFGACVFVVVAVTVLRTFFLS